MGFFSSLFGDFFSGGDDEAQAYSDYWSTSGGWGGKAESPITVGRDYDPWQDDSYTFGGSWGNWNN